MALLQIKSLSHKFTGSKVYTLKAINLTIEQGSFVVLAGANGSGKTVLVRHFNGLIAPTEGKILLEGNDIYDDIIRTRSQIGMVFQDPDSQFVGQTVAEDVAFGPENLNLPEEEVNDRVQRALETVHLSHLSDRRPYQLSGGEKRRLAIAGILAMQSRLLVLDEPFVGLDYDGVVQVLKAIVHLHKNHHTIVLITHDIEKVMAHADRLLVMHQGEIVRDIRKPVRLDPMIEQYGIRVPYGNNRAINSMTWLR